MGAVAAASLALVGQAYTAIAGNQESQKAKGQANTLIDAETKQSTALAATASEKAAQAADIQAKRAKAAAGQATTVLTSPLGAPAAPTQRKTLLGI